MCAFADCVRCSNVLTDLIVCQYSGKGQRCTNPVVFGCPCKFLCELHASVHAKNMIKSPAQHTQFRTLSECLAAKNEIGQARGKMALVCVLIIDSANCTSFANKTIHVILCAEQNKKQEERPA